MNTEWSDSNQDVLHHVLSQLVTFLNKETCQNCTLVQCDEMKSAQQRVFSIKVQTSNNMDGEDQHDNDTKYVYAPSPIGKRILDVMGKSNGRLVLRIWKAGARWWNLTCNAQNECIKLAKSEVAGYKVARLAFECYYENYQSRDVIISHEQPRIYIPQVLYFFEDVTVGCNNPWALFSHAKQDGNIITKGASANTRSDKYRFCDEFIFQMVKVRREFGFDEPHPRHGRVCVDHALEYAMHVLNDIIIPMHTVFFTNASIMSKMKEDIHTLNRHNVYSNGRGVTYQDMVNLYLAHIRKIQSKIKNENSQHLEDNGMYTLVQSLEDFVSRLWYENKVVQDFPLPFTLCHLDLQPQNMILCQSTISPSSSTSDQPKVSRNVPWIVSILDWEESCYADPRFELLLLCRKVVANRLQADKLWYHYSAFVEERFQRNKVGPMDPWLRLESVHSLLTMCLQGMNLLEGGRSPWEGNSDLRGKIDRELHRLQNDLGWSLS
jgi:Choline/ethanolamine kinase.